MHRTGHILLLHHSDGERLRHVTDWLGAGLSNEEKILYVDVAGYGEEALVATLTRQGLSAATRLSEGRLEFVGLDEFLRLSEQDELVDRALDEQGFPGVRLAVRGDSLSKIVSAEEHLALERTLARLCHTRPVSVLCQYDGRTTHGPELATALDLHPDWVYEADLSMRRRGHVIRIEGELDTLDGEVLVRSLSRMTQDLATEPVLALDLRNVDALTPGACRALLEGTRRFRERGGLVHCGTPSGDAGWLVRMWMDHDVTNFELF